MKGEKKFSMKICYSVMFVYLLDFIRLCLYQEYIFYSFVVVLLFFMY